MMMRTCNYVGRGPCREDTAAGGSYSFCNCRYYRHHRWRTSAGRIRIVREFIRFNATEISLNTHWKRAEYAAKMSENNKKNNVFIRKYYSVHLSKIVFVDQGPSARGATIFGQKLWIGQRVHCVLWPWQREAIEMKSVSSRFKIGCTRPFSTIAVIKSPRFTCTFRLVLVNASG